MTFYVPLCACTAAASGEREPRWAIPLADPLELPPLAGETTAARALSIGKGKAYKLIEALELSREGHPLGSTSTVSTLQLRELLGVCR